MMRHIPTRQKLLEERSKLLLQASDGEHTLEDLRRRLERDPYDQDAIRALEDFQPRTIPYIAVARHLQSVSHHLAGREKKVRAHFGLETMKTLILEGRPLPSDPHAPAEPKRSHAFKNLHLAFRVTGHLLILTTLVFMLLDTLNLL